MTEDRKYTGTILRELEPVITPQIILDCAAIYAAQTSWIAQYAARPQTQNPPPIFYSNPGWEFFLENLQLNYYAASLPSAPAPEIKANSSQADKLIAVNAISREFKKFEISLLQRESPTGEWQLLGIENLHNYGNRFNFLNLKNPFLTQGEVDIFGRFSQLAIRFKGKDESRRIEVPTATDIMSVRGCWRGILSL
ncbi:MULTISPECIES: hypothetical protein [unclassified Microcoleus]|uniref:hypothetical protein n=1 Tax=unclassified Microcoleus TaxID=2642155 RepID=UPI001DEECE73|nr:MULTISPECIES: hypothetical protein [unclassified Microcoleus]MCC3473988.1 hypothetical protein [Microcoleus sp. PH2017_13_LAR_U_A]MCC3486070.1 hypothetical protein [Microcoleus sp. PH2017_14_LAR_D_A]MCC3598602.1 hypothetical protein [Microcoleus sp. PH2017_26_ELK_O_A]MCC3623916.1 hypothetical protein [Microcoleus sp. PH2017_36_ELK_O_B]